MKLKKWVVTLLTIINIWCIFLASGECEDDKVFIVKTICCIVIIVFNSITLYLFGGFEDGSI